MDFFMPYKSKSSLFFSCTNSNSSGAPWRMLDSERRQQVSRAKFASSPHPIKMSFSQHKQHESRPNQLTAIFFLCLLVGAEAVKTSEQVNYKKTSTNKKEFQKQGAVDKNTPSKQQVYEHVCTDKSFRTFNKPNMTLGIQDKRIVPKACLTGEARVCKEHSVILDQFKPFFDTLSQARATVVAKQKNWVETALVGLSSPIMDRRQLVIFQGIMNTLSLINNHSLSALEAKRIGGGNCGESTSRSLMRLIHSNLRNKLDMKIQLVTMFASKSKNTIKDHIYILLDSDINDVDIKGDVRKTGQIIRSITEGKICDPWNYGYFADLKSDESGFYKSEAGWDSLSIKTVTLNFQDFNALPEEAQQHVRQKLSAIGKLLNMKLYPEQETDCDARPTAAHCI